MKITLKLDAKPIKQIPYRLHPKYKEKVCQELDKRSEECIIEPIEESNSVSPMVVQGKKRKGKIRIFIDPQKINDACVYDLFPTLFTNEVLDNVGGHVVCKQGLVVEPAKITVIVNLEASRNVKQLRVMLGHMGYYRKFIKAYAQITVPMEKVLKKDTTLCWDKEC
eukprot:PITA_29037